MSPDSAPGYNERSWVIDLVSEINRYSDERHRGIRRAGGEYSLADNRSSLFPDLLLFGDSAGHDVVQGWELKFPDTSVDDPELIENATRKATVLRLDSFVVWNVDLAKLYRRGEDGNFSEHRTWGPLGISNRADVRSEVTAWTQLLHQMLEELNDLFDYGDLHASRLEIVLSDAVFAYHVESYAPRVAEELKRACQRDAVLAAEVRLWWTEESAQYPRTSEYLVLARLTVMHWINRMIFARSIERLHVAAHRVRDIQAGSSIADAVKIFSDLSKQADFFSVFNVPRIEQIVDAETWQALLALNTFASEAGISSLASDQLGAIQTMALTFSKRKLAGQFVTPRPLADLLVALTVYDATMPVIDPCCGTGTIAAAANAHMRSLGIDAHESMERLWASDKFSFPLQLCGMALADPSSMGQVTQVFQEDVFALLPGSSHSFTSPDTGQVVDRTLPRFGSIVSNLPFVSFESIKELNPSVIDLVDGGQLCTADGTALSGRADLYAYILCILPKLLDSGGRVGVIVSNAWLSSRWADSFRNLLSERLQIEMVVTSAAGRWFDNASVVTNIIILSLPSDNSPVAPETSFVSIQAPISTWDGSTAGARTIADHLIAGRSEDTLFRRRNYRATQIEQFESLGVGWNALFADLSWLPACGPALLPVSELLDVGRGERRGWDPLFYPSAENQIETDYQRPVLKSPKEASGYLATAEGIAFCCSLSMQELEGLGHYGALDWIRRFEGANNEKDKALTQVLKRPHQRWYEMSDTTMADFVIAMNPDERIAVHRLVPSAFVNQRLIRMTLRDDSRDLADIMHALLNSIISIFLIEANGFGRGLGALDLNATTMSKRWRMLDPRRLDEEATSRVLDAFEPVRNRQVMPIGLELADTERQTFDGVVLAEFGLSQYHEQMRAALQELFDIRKAAIR
jgi:methylase of polypeptide subunit release factors